MSDPFSIAGSAVGVVSLGIVACQTLYSLIDDVKTAGGKAEDIQTELDRLESHLEQLETELKKLDSTSPVAATSANVVACAKALNRIRQELPSTTSTGDSRIREQFRVLKFRLSYPFKKGELEYLRSLVKGIQQDLHTALLSVIMYVKLTMDQLD